MKICIVVGTRPEIIKMASVIKELSSRNLGYSLIHTGQHYAENLSQVFFDELSLPSPIIDLETGSGTQAEQTATAMIRLEQAFLKLSPKIILVQGDTNTTLAGALTAAKMGIKVGHVESGLRSYDLRMPEEHNRRLADHLSSFLYAPTSRALEVLGREACWGRKYLTGNTVIDACEMYLDRAEKESQITQKIGLDDFCLATIHRAENVDNPDVLKELCSVFLQSPLPIVLPLHPRTKGRLQQYGLMNKLEASTNVIRLESLGYFDFLVLLRKCRLVLSDSGGIQEEVTSPKIRKRVLVLRDSTERSEAVEAGYAEVVGTASGFVLSRLKEAISTKWVTNMPSPYGKGEAGRLIVDAMEKEPLIWD